MWRSGLVTDRSARASSTTHWRSLLAWDALTFTAAGIGSALTSTGLDPWYRTLDTPPWSPPDAVFGPVWTVLYLLMAVAVWLVWEHRRDVPVWRAHLAIGLFVVQLALNTAWSGVFFGLRSPGGGLAVILALFAAILATIVAFHGIHRVAAWLLAPYLAWVGFATVLNAAIWRLA
jgi:translocator protein